jgi:hypothetical protein
MAKTRSLSAAFIVFQTSHIRNPTSKDPSVYLKKRGFLTIF